MPKTKKKGAAPNWPEWKVKREIERTKKDATNEATLLTVSLMLLVLQDKFGMEGQIHGVWEEWNKYAEAVAEGRVKLHEVRDTLRKEYEIGI